MLHEGSLRTHDLLTLRTPRSAARPLIRRAAACAAALSICCASAQDCEIAKLAAPNGFPTDLFGYSLALSQNRAAMGMPNYLWTPVGGVGAAWTYVRVSGAWTPEEFLTASDGATGDIFGFAVAMQDGRLAVSARGKDVLAQNAGAAQHARVVIARDRRVRHQPERVVARQLRDAALHRFDARERRARRHRLARAARGRKMEALTLRGRNGLD